MLYDFFPQYKLVFTHKNTLLFLCLGVFTIKNQSLVYVTHHQLHR